MTMLAATDAHGIAEIITALATLVGAVSGLVALILSVLNRGQVKVTDTKIEAVSKELSAERHERRGMTQTVSTLAFLADPKQLPTVPTWPPKSEEKK